MSRTATKPTPEPAAPALSTEEAARQAAEDAQRFEAAPSPPGTVSDAPVSMTPSQLADLVASAAAAAVATAMASMPAATTTVVSPGSLPSLPEPTEQEIAVAQARDARVRELITPRTHAEGCPGLPENGGRGRVEFYGARRPANPQKAEPARDLTIVRCQECGGTRPIEGAPEVNGL
jgi:hypothetical protein